MFFSAQIWGRPSGDAMDSMAIGQSIHDGNALAAAQFLEYNDSWN
jgi:hypothetical protein